MFAVKPCSYSVTLNADGNFVPFVVGRPF
ncbi:MAG: hypothetical protein GDYSWBUE_000380, partial [Candidatus Fervidibacterota bacterium]